LATRQNIGKTLEKLPIHSHFHPQSPLFLGFELTSFPTGSSRLQRNATPSQGFAGQAKTQYGLFVEVKNVIFRQKTALAALNLRRYTSSL